MTLTIDLTPTEEAQLQAAASRQGVAPAEVIHNLLNRHLPDAQVPDSKDPTIALLESWLEEDATDDPAEIEAAQRELDEFQQAINAERERAGARRVYP